MHAWYTYALHVHVLLELGHRTVAYQVVKLNNVY